METARVPTKVPLLAPTSAAQWVGRRPAEQMVTGLVPGQGTCLGFGPGLWSGLM